MNYYNFFSGFYDRSLKKLYFSSRKCAVEMLDLQDGQTILDVGSGTGANFRHFYATGKNISVYGTDFSRGMLKKAEAEIKKQGLRNYHVFQSDARQLDRETIDIHTGKKEFDRIICALGLSVIPEWEQVLDRLLLLLKPGGRLVVMDVFAENRTLNTWLVEKIAHADLSRNIPEAMRIRTADFHLQNPEISERKVGGKLFVASGSKS